MTRYEIATKAEILAIFERSKDLLNQLLDQDNEDYDAEVERERSRGIRYVIESFRFCAQAAAALRDPSLGGVVMAAIERARDFDEHAENHHDAMDHALSVLLDMGLAVDKRIRAFAKSDDAGLREAVATGLKPRGAAERALLESLAADPVAAVRKAAKKSLASVRDVPWWTGKWQSDPAARLLPGEIDACGPALRRISEILDHSQYTILHRENHLAELLAELGKLPDPLAVEAIEHLLRASEHYFFPAAEALLLLLFERRGGLEALDRLIDVWGRGLTGLGFSSELSKVVGAAPPETRLLVCQRLLARAAGAPPAERVELHDSPAWLAATIVSEAWPPDVNVTPVLDAVLALGAEELPDNATDYVRSKLAETLGLDGLDPTPVLDRLVEARVAGYTGAWEGIHHRADVLLASAPVDVLRRTAERALASEDPATIRWGARLLLDEAFDPGADGPLLERIRAMIVDPRLRPVLLGDRDLVNRALPVLRSELRRDALSYPEAVKTFEGIGHLYGRLANRTTVEPIEQQHLTAQEEVAAFLGPTELRGPPTAMEWEALRRARAAFPDASLERRANLWVRTLSEGPWTAEERADFDGFFESLREGHAEVGFALGSALGSKPDADMMPLFDEIVTRCEDRARPLLKHLRGDARVTLGLPRRPEQPGASGANANDDDDDDELPAGDWADDDEE